MNVNSPLNINRLVLLGLLLLLTACTPLVPVQPTSEAPSPAALPMISPASTTESTTHPNIQPTIIPTSSSTAVAIPVTTACQDAAQYISDDGLDGTMYASNVAFTKTWRLKNVGTCTWNSTYLVAYLSGTAMSQQPGYWILPQGQTVAPGQTVDISVGMTSPNANGIYVAYWGLKQVDGQFMPIQGGANGNSFYAQVKVGIDSTSGGDITDASIGIEREEGSGENCSPDTTYFVHAYITADGPTTAAYEINSTAGQIAAGYFQTSPTDPLVPVVSGTLVFDQAGTKTIHYRLIGPYPYPQDITVNLSVNGGEWHKTKLSCQ